jgi:citrate lyase subunit beta / citryl-CoA lyase
MCLLAAKAANVMAIDGVFTDIKNQTHFTSEAKDAFIMGFDGKLTLHPGQITLSNEAFCPTAEELAEARDICMLNFKSTWARS